MSFKATESLIVSINLYDINQKKTNHLFAKGMLFSQFADIWNLKIPPPPNSAIPYHNPVYLIDIGTGINNGDD